MKLIFRILRVSVVICVVVLLLDTFFNNNLEKLLDMKVWGFYYFYSFVLTAINITFFAVFRRKVGWLNAGFLRVVLASAGSIGLTLIGFFFCRLIDKTVFNDIEVSSFLQNENFSYYLFPLLFTTIVSLFFHLLYFYRALQEQKVTEQKIIAGTASAQFDALKNQLDPHFLFNSLNVLSSLIEENPDQAQKFTSSLSKVYRYVLEQKDKELVNIEEELAFAVTYMNLLKMRFESSIFYEVQEKFSNPEAKVVPLSLQLLLENTVKHNIVSENKPLYIRLYEEEGYLVVENDFQKKEVIQKRRGVGLRNIVERYAHITTREVFIEENTSVFRVKLPLLTKQIIVMETKDTTDDNSYFRAKQRVKEIKEFYGNLISYCLVIPFLIFINYRTYWEFQWFWFPLFGWGLGLAIHGFTVFGYGTGWEERKIREIMEKEENKKSWK